jgi:tRNA(fMet)-specific endonuclease VapC
MLRYLLDTNIVVYVLKRRPIEVLPYGVKAAQHYGAIRAVLEKLGRPIGVNDLHIAGHARSEGLVLVTNNLSEFERVPALEMENWVDAGR